MKSRKEILQKVEKIKNENLINEDRKQHFSEQKEFGFDRVEIYERMIRENDLKLDILFWVLNQE
jgi:hypothetical protein